MRRRRADLVEACRGIRDAPVISMDELADKARQMSGPMDPVETTDRIVGVIEWRDGTVIDVVRQLKKK